MSSKNKSSKRQSDKAKDLSLEKDLDLSFGSENFSGFDAALDDLKGSFFSKSSESKGVEYFDSLEGAAEDSEGQGDMNQAFVEENSRITIDEEEKEKVFDLEMKPEIRIEDETNYTNKMNNNPSLSVAIEGNEIRQKWWCQSCLVSEEKKQDRGCVLL